MAAAREVFLNLNICEHADRLGQVPAKHLCHYSRRATFTKMHEWPVFRRVTHSQTTMTDFEILASSFTLAALSLPQPFTIVESGNLCGATTVMLALLKRHLCPSCRMVSMDPGGYRTDPTVREKFTCAADSLQWAGVSDEVHLVDEITPTVEVELPVGFVFLDDGKIRFSNDPLMTLLEAKLMRGAVVAMHDAWQTGKPPNSRLSLDHPGQIGIADEMVESGVAEMLVLSRKGWATQTFTRPQEKLRSRYTALANANGDPWKSSFHHMIVVRRIPDACGAIYSAANDTIEVRAEVADGAGGTDFSRALCLPLQMDESAGPTDRLARG